MGTIRETFCTLNFKIISVFSEVTDKLVYDLAECGLWHSPVLDTSIYNSVQNLQYT